MIATDRIEGRLRRDAEQGEVYPNKDVARTFAWLPPKDLIFKYVVSNWPLGQDLPAFDILARNGESANLTARFDRDMSGIYARNLVVKSGGVTTRETPIDLSKVDRDNFAIAGKTDHITSWKPCYMSPQVLGGRAR